MEDKRLETLEQDMHSLKAELGDVNKKIDEILDLVSSMNVGIYGDRKNKYKGVLEKQEEIDKEIEELKVQIKAIQDKDREQDLNFSVKRTFKQEAVEVTKEFVKLVIQLVGLYLVFKGIMIPDSLV